MSTVIRFNNLKIGLDKIKEPNRRGMASGEEYRLIRESVLRLLSLPGDISADIEIKSKSLDARKGRDACFVYAVDAAVDADISSLPVKLRKKAYILRGHTRVFSPYIDKKPDFSGAGRPVVVGAGPAGLFAAYILALNGAGPLLIEQGGKIEDRAGDVEKFWNGTGALNPYSNVCFGEGGAGTFSDGKLSTSAKDTFGRIDFIKRVLAEHGAPEEIMYLKRPHIGTDRLRDVVINMRKSITRLGGTVMFDTRLEDIKTEDGRLAAIDVADVKSGSVETIPCRHMILATGHSARQTYEMLEKKLPLCRKDFAAGLRIQHRQEYLDNLQYGKYARLLPPADYSVRYHTKTGRAAYSFCMCPGGYVVNAATEDGCLSINGMSDYARDSENGNSAIVVNVSAQDVSGDGPLAGIRFQREIERLAYESGGGKIPCQLYGDYKEKKAGNGSFGSVKPVTKGGVCFANLRGILPEYINAAIIEAMEYFGEIMPGFNADDALLCGVETRTSSPVRIPRGEDMQSEIRGIIPCGEGAGYAGGIMSASADGIKAAFSILDLQ